MWLGFASTTFACFKNKRIDLPWNHDFKRKLSIADTAIPAIGSHALIPRSATNRSIFIGILSNQSVFPMDSTYLRRISSEESAGDPSANQSRNDWLCFESLRSRSWEGDNCLFAKATPMSGTPFTFRILAKAFWPSGENPRRWPFAQFFEWHSKIYY